MTQRICVVGAGPGGLSALKIIKDTPECKAGKWDVVAYEAREDIGGVWLPAPPTDDPPLTPLYDSLTTNLPHPIMSFPSLPFPPSTPLYPRASVVLSYLKLYSAHFGLTPHIQLSTSVISVERTQHGQRWAVTLSTGETHPFDLVIVANGHYRAPRVPTTPGLAAWLASGRATHASTYRHPLPEHRDKTVLVVGAGPSGTDISAELRGVAQAVVHSITGGGASPPSGTPPAAGALRVRGRATEYRADGSVVFEDGAVEPHIDRCILATGYKFSFPFLSPFLVEGLPPPAPPLPAALHNSGAHLFPLARHLWPLAPRAAPPHTLAFVGLPVRVAPFPLLEAQARALVRAFAEPGALDPAAEAVGVIERVEALRRALGRGADERAIAHAWHRFEGEEQFEHRDELNEWAVGRRPGEGEANGGKVEGWVKEMYSKKETLRVQWRELEREGVAEEWVKGVGEGGVQDWVELMRKLIRRAEKRGSVSIESGKL